MKVLLSVAFAACGVAIVTAVPVLASQNPGYPKTEIQVESSETPEPTLEPSPGVVVPSPKPSMTIIPPRTQPPNPENPENGGNVGGGIVGRGGEDKPEFRCDRNPACPSKVP